MAITITWNPVKPAKLQASVGTIAGASASTAYVLSVTDPNGFKHNLRFTTDGAGGATVTFTPQSSGSHTAALRPAAELAGTTTAAFTGTLSTGG